MAYKVAVVGATGNVGREMLNILEELEFPVDEIHAIASRKSTYRCRREPAAFPALSCRAKRSARCNG